MGIANDISQEGCTMYRVGNKHYLEWFNDKEEIEIQYSRHRFVYADRLDQANVWKEIQQEYKSVIDKRRGV